MYKVKLIFIFLSILLFGGEVNETMAQAERIQFQGASFDIYRVKLDERAITFYYKNAEGKAYKNFASLKAQVEAEGKELLFATNAGIFDPARVPVGLTIENGKKIQSLNTRKGKGNFYLLPNGVFAVGSKGAVVMTTAGFYNYNYKGAFLIASQSGPMLVIDGKIHPAFNKPSTNKYIRNGVGVVSGNEVVFVISNEEVNFHLMATFFRDYLKCNNALYLDGSISKAYIPDLNRKELGGNFAGIIAVVE